ncbi:neurofilament light polypeptide [Alosa sapidissima]|uniref:neurofilament light polypeptide n=1 Tax=Alosa sapidissima TaxID=34773 RepID=UPI001C09A969|nr:neurofilament light polypeptide [Alosa sapidissima]
MSYDPYYPSSYKRWYGDSAPRQAPRTRSSTRVMYSTHGAAALSSSASSRLHHYLSPSRASSTAAMELDLSQAAHISSEFRVVRTQEKAQLQELNDRFAGFIERVHELEQQNRALEAELGLLRQRHAEPSRLRALYEQEARRLRDATEEARLERQAALEARERAEEALHGLQAHYEQEALGREEAEGKLLEARKAADEVALQRAELEKQVETLADELAFLKRLHEGEVSELQAQVQYGAHVAVETEAARPDLSSALRDIRAQYERLAARNMQAAEEWFRGKVGSLTETVAQHSDAVRSSKDEAGEYRRQLQSRILEIDACRGLNDSLEKQLHEMEDKQSGEIAAMQDTIGQLEDELRATKGEMAHYLKEYQDLLNVKMALDIEIAAYRKLLEGEESRFNVGMGGGVSSLYSHSLSAGPVFSRPLFSSMSSGVPYLLSSRLLSSSYSSADEVITSAQAPKAEATPTKEEEEEEEEEEGKEEEEEVKEEEEKEEEAEEEEKGEEEEEKEEEKEEGEEAEAEAEAEAEGEEEDQKEEGAGKEEEEEEKKEGEEAEEEGAKESVEEGAEEAGEVESSEAKEEEKDEAAKDEGEKEEPAKEEGEKEAPAKEEVKEAEAKAEPKEEKKADVKEESKAKEEKKKSDEKAESETVKDEGEKPKPAPKETVKPEEEKKKEEAVKKEKKDEKEKKDDKDKKEEPEKAKAKK